METGNLESAEIYPTEVVEVAQSKKPYIKPSFRFERVFETQALNCGKIHNQFGACHITPKTS